MNRNASTAETDTGTPTHVLIWIPGSLTKGSTTKGAGEDCWVFMTYHDALTGAEQPTLDGPCFPRDAHPHDLHSWVEARLGHPVVLVADTESAGRHWWSIRRVRVPSYYIYPA